MITSDDFCDGLAEQDIDLVAGVPCSFFSAPIARLTREGHYVAAPNEGSALAIAAGAVAAGRRSAVLLQNSGLGNLLNPLTSLVMTYRIPMVAFMSLRGWPDPDQDEPQHAVMGTVGQRLLDTLGVGHHLLTPDVTRAGFLAVLDQVSRETAEGRAVFVLVQKGAVARHDPAAIPEPVRQPAAEPALSRPQALRALQPLLAGYPVVATTGFTSRELFARGDSPDNFYMQGSMGHASAFALGVALGDGTGDAATAVLDGDGAALMHLGAMSTIGALGPRRFLHVIFDNGAYESTGAQATTAGSTDFAAVALACGYTTAVTCRTEAEIGLALARVRDQPGPHLCVITVGTRDAADPAPPRATSQLTAPGIYQRFGSRLRHAGPAADADRGADRCAATT